MVYFEFGFVWFGLGLVGRSDVACRRTNGQTDTRADGTVGRTDQTSGKRTDERRDGPDNGTNGRTYFVLDWFWFGLVWLSLVWVWSAGRTGGRDEQTVERTNRHTDGQVRDAEIGFKARSRKIYMSKIADWVLVDGCHGRRANQITNRKQSGSDSFISSFDMEIMCFWSRNK